MEMIPTIETTEQLSVLFGALADPSRMQMLLMMMDGEKRSGQFADLLEITPSAVSHQLRWLRERDIVKGRKIGREVYYELADDCIREIIEVALRHVQEGLS